MREPGKMNIGCHPYRRRRCARTFEAMGVYRVTCVTREPCDESEFGRHITGARIEGPEGSRDFEVGPLRLMISSGDVLTIGDPAEAQAEIRKGRCACGLKTIRNRRSDWKGPSLNAVRDC